MSRNKISKEYTKLAEVERELRNLMGAIKQGIVTVSTKAEVEKAETERARLFGQLQARTAQADPVTPMLPNLNEWFKAIVGNLAAIQPVAKAREALKGVLGSTITLHPCADGDVRYLTAEVTVNYAGLLRLTVGKIKVVEGRRFYRR